MEKLISQAKAIIKSRYHKDKHTVGAALRTKSGKIYTGISINGQKLNLCCEWVALGRAFIDGETEIEAIVAVHLKEDGTFVIFPPCALCRELYVTYCPEAQVIISETQIVEAKKLLPYAWKKKPKLTLATCKW